MAVEDAGKLTGTSKQDLIYFIILYSLLLVFNRRFRRKTPTAAPEVVRLNEMQNLATAAHNSTVPRCRMQMREILQLQQEPNE